MLVEDTLKVYEILEQTRYIVLVPSVFVHFAYIQ